MSFYETLYIVDPNLENKSLEKTMNEIGKELEKTKSKIINHRIWGKKRLAYSIERQKYGSYILLQFEGGDQQKMVEYDTWMRLNNSVLRHMTVLLNDKPACHSTEPSYALALNCLTSSTYHTQPFFVDLHLQIEEGYRIHISVFR